MACARVSPRQGLTYIIVSAFLLYFLSNGVKFKPPSLPSFLRQGTPYLSRCTSEPSDGRLQEQNTPISIIIELSAYYPTRSFRAVCTHTLRDDVHLMFLSAIKMAHLDAPSSSETCMEWTSRCSEHGFHRLPSLPPTTLVIHSVPSCGSSLTSLPLTN
jgi:hypothetical protein